jgi:glycyl-tRNA synthetase beta chain
VDRELLLEIGCEELPAPWLPALTNQIGEIVATELRAERLDPASPAETFSTPRRLTVRIARVPERQADREEVISGPPVQAAFTAAGAPTPAAIGFAARQGVDVGALERVETPKGVYLAFRKHQRGKAAVDVLPLVLGSALRKVSFPKSMHWDASLEDGRGELVFGRPIRWLLFLYGGRVVPFSIARTPAAQTGQVQDVSTGAVTYGHRFLTTSGRAGRAIKVRSFDEYRGRLIENFVMLERAARHDKIVRELDAKALRLKGRVSRIVGAESELLHEVPDLVEYPSVVAGTFAPEFLELPDEVLTTTLIHHQHFFPVESEAGRLMPAFLAVTNTEPDNERVIARNAERVVSARLRDARFFWDADRRVPLEQRLERLSTLTFHVKLGSYLQKAERIERLARWIAAEAFKASEDVAGWAALAARLAKTDLTTDMVREFTELQGTMGGVYARAQGLPEPVWKAIYYHYLPIGLEADAAPTRAQLGEAGPTWACVALADKLDTTAGLFSVGEKPTGSRDPYGLRRAAQGIVKILADLSELGVTATGISIGALIDRAFEGFGRGARAGDGEEWGIRLSSFFAERVRHLLVQRGAAYDEVNAVVRAEATLDELAPATALARTTALAEARSSEEFEALAELFKRVKNISKGVRFDPGAWPELVNYAESQSREAAEQDLIKHVAASAAFVQDVLARGDYVAALKRISLLRPSVARYFDQVLVMADDEQIRRMRLALMAGLRDLVMNIADIAEIVPRQGS